jgi:translation elongation factor EF-1alpha|tara:strand:- start:1196 stop:1399 length:204 start_codon:yes stop_codon:yes gene_type:complete
MSKVTINDKEYDTDSMTEEQLELLNVLQQNTVIANQLDHQIQCVRAVGKVKLEELVKLLDVKEEKKT